MNKNAIPSYNEYLQKLSNLPAVELTDLSYYLNKHPALLQYFNICPNIVYVFNYPKRHYSYISNNILTILGHHPEAVYEGGAALFTYLFHKDDFKIFSEQTFRDNIKFLTAVDHTKRDKYRMSLTYRFRREDGSFAVILMQNTFVETDPAGNPLLSFGTLTDITPYKTDTRIIHRIEELTDQGTNKLLFTHYYYPNEKESILSKREVEILKWIIEGLNSPQIADKLHLSNHTVRTHRKHLMEKTNAKNVAELIKYAVQSGII